MKIGTFNKLGRTITFEGAYWVLVMSFFYLLIVRIR